MCSRVSTYGTDPMGCGAPQRIYTYLYIKSDFLLRSYFGSSPAPIRLLASCPNRTWCQQGSRRGASNRHRSHDRRLADCRLRSCRRRSGLGHCGRPLDRRLAARRQRLGLRSRLGSARPKSQRSRCRRSPLGAARTKSQRKRCRRSPLGAARTKSRRGRMARRPLDRRLSATQRRIGTLGIYPKAVWLETVGSVFGSFSAKPGPGPSRSPGLALQLNLHEKSTSQTNSKPIS